MCGVPAGYLLWNEVEITMSDLRECAVDVGIFPAGKPRKLGRLERAGELDNWEPDRPTSWFKSIRRGKTFDKTAPLLLRPAVSNEFPASWYIEDGSGRAIAFVANQGKFDPSQILAIGYLGCQPDPHSSFMQERFLELLDKGIAGR